MAYCDFLNVAIGGIAVAVPKNISYNRDSKDFSERQIERFVKNVGVVQKRISRKEQTSCDLGYEAANALLKHKNIAPDSINFLVFITQNADYFSPSTAYVLAHRLGLSNDCMPFDINLGCSAFVYGVHTAASFLNGGSMNRGLVIIADVPKKGFENKNDSLLFGDCGSAVLLERKNNSSIKSLLKSDGNRYTALITRGGLSRHPIDSSMDYYSQVKSSMDGQDVMSFSITDVPQTINDFLERSHQSVLSFDVILLHQANMMMNHMIIQKIDVTSLRPHLY